MNQDVDYEKKITYIVSKYSADIRDDMKQELLMTLNSIEKELKSNIKNIENYIFKVLSNKALNINIKYCKFKEKYISLDSINTETGTPLLDTISSVSNKNRFDEYSLLLNDAMKKTLSKREFDFINLYYYEQIRESDIAKKHSVSIQYVSKTIKTGVKKLKEYFDKIKKKEII